MTRLGYTLASILFLLTTGLASPVAIKWHSTTHSKGPTPAASAPVAKTSGSNGSSRIYFHQTFSDVKTHDVHSEPDDDEQQQRQQQHQRPPPQTNRTYKEATLNSEHSTESGPEEPDTQTSYSTSIDHGDLGGSGGSGLVDHLREPPASSGITKRNVHYPTIPSDVINERDDDDDVPANGKRNRIGKNSKQIVKFCHHR